MTILQISGKDTIKNLKNDPRMYYIVIIGALLTTIGFALTKDPVTLIFLSLATAATFFLLNRDPREVNIKLNDDLLDTGSSTVEWSTVDSWAVLDEGNWLEIVIRTTHLTRPYLTFYIAKSNPKTQDFLVLLSERVSYDETAITQNWVHNFLKLTGLR